MLTALSYVLDSDDMAVVLDDGRKFRPELVGVDLVSYTHLTLPTIYSV